MSQTLRNSLRWESIFRVLPHLQGHAKGPAASIPWRCGEAGLRSVHLKKLPQPVRDVLLIEYLRSVLPICKVKIPRGAPLLYKAHQALLEFALHPTPENMRATQSAIPSAIGAIDAVVPYHEAIRYDLYCIRLVVAGLNCSNEAEEIVYEAPGPESPCYIKATIVADCADAVRRYAAFDSNSQREHKYRQSVYAAQWRWMKTAYVNALWLVSPEDWKPAWNSSTAQALARGIFNELAFDQMPILADALQDADCDNETVLDHLRDPESTFTRADQCLWKVMGLDAKLSPVELT